MIKKRGIMIAFILVALVQLYIPASMILQREAILETGKEYRFRTEPIDPTDPFRGKYITLRFKEDMIPVETESEWHQGEVIYAELTTDSRGFAKVLSVSKERPADPSDYLTAKVNYLATTDSSNLLVISYPFDRYYMEESKAYEAELAYRESVIDTNQVACALVIVKDGDAVLKDVLIDGVPIREVVLEARKSGL